MEKLNKILSILTVVMLVITLVLAAFFYFGGVLEGTKDKHPIYTGSFLNWAFVLTFISAGLAIIFPLIQMFQNPKAAIKGIGMFLGLGVIILIGYLFADGSILSIPGYTGSPNTEGWLKFSDTMLITMYVLGIGTILAIAVTEIIRKFR